MTVQRAALQDIRRADGIRVRIDPERIGITAAAEEKGKRQFYGFGRRGQAETEFLFSGQGAGLNPEYFRFSGECDFFPFERPGAGTFQTGFAVIGDPDRNTDFLTGGEDVPGQKRQREYVPEKAANRSGSAKGYGFGCR